MERLSRAFSLFIVFQFVTLAAGVCAILLTTSGLYVVFLFGQAIAMIVFSIITSNLLEKALRRKYPEVKPDRHISIGTGGIRFGVDWRGPLKARAGRSQDQLAEEVFRKQEITWLLMIVTMVVLAGLASAVY